MFDIYFVLAGFFVGTVVGLTGVGGGSLMTPLLIFLMGLKPHMAVGTDLLFAAITKSGGTYSLWRQKLIPWRVVAHLSLGSIPGCLATIYILSQYDLTSSQAEIVIKRTLGFALLLTAASLFYKVLRTSKTKQISESSDNANSTFTEPDANSQTNAQNTISISASVALQSNQSFVDGDSLQTKHPVLTILLGFFIGSMVTLTSVGAGAIGVSVLMLLYPRLPLPRIVAADIAYAVPLTLLAGLGHAGLGTVDWGLLFKLALGSLPGIWVGAHLLTRTSERFIRLSLSILLAWAAGKLLFV